MIVPAVDLSQRPYGTEPCSQLTQQKIGFVPDVKLVAECPEPAGTLLA